MSKGELSTTSFHNRRAWELESGDLQVTIMQCGGHVAAITSKRTGLNPLWIQERPTIDSDQYDAVLHGAQYGVDGEAKMIAGLLGHNLCLPFWGAPSEAEYRAGMTCHGETNVVRWKALQQEKSNLRLEARLPESGIRVERKLECLGPLVKFETIAENLSAWDRPLAWCEHVTFGSPFLEAGVTQFAANLGRGYRTSVDFENTFAWPEGRGEIICDLTRFSGQPHTDLVNSFLVKDEGGSAFFAAWNAARRTLIGYVFNANDFRWMNVWENNDHRWRTRAMEFSSTPIEGTSKALLATPTLFGVPTFEWLPARSQIKKSFIAFSVEIGSAYPGVTAIRQGDGGLTIESIVPEDDIIIWTV